VRQPGAQTRENEHSAKRDPADLERPLLADPLGFVHAVDHLRRKRVGRLELIDGQLRVGIGQPCIEICVTEAETLPERVGLLQRYAGVGDRRFGLRPLAEDLFGLGSLRIEAPRDVCQVIGGGFERRLQIGRHRRAHLLQ